ncbi:putative tetratricopeptide-like helical domain superfamily [Helianthus annuus]|nr:putative tetratricopeptide-like helical domain superfamily [Helianthus annuus]
MKTLISNPKFISSFPSLPHNNPTFLNFKITKPIPPHPSTTSCSCSTSTDHGGWADLISTSNSTESTHLNRLLSSLGIDEKKYAFVYLFGFVCALGFSRVRVSSIVVFPACFLVFAVGFSFGVVNRWDFNEVLSNSGKKSKKKGVIKDEEFRVLSEGLRSLVDLFDGFGLKFGSLKESMRKDVDCNRVSKSDLVGYIESVESIEQAIVEAKSMIEGYMVVDGNDVSKSLNHKPSDQTKKPEGKGFDISRLIAGFQERSFGSKVSKMKDTVKSDRNQEKVVDPVVEDKTMKSVNGEDKSAYNDGDVRVKETYGGKTLLAVGQLGNTYLLHGELKLKLSRKLRALLAESDSNVIGRLDDEVSNREKFVDYLVNVCEECEELLVKAGRKYRLALSIDADDMRALYNWGLALSFRAQLIADIGPEAAFDADKVYLAAIDKFNAMMSRSNAHTPDALFRWGVALQQRSRLRTRNYREKVKLLSQAKRLYEDALLMDSNNPQVKQALMTCESELRYKNRF